ncbi:MAG: hypothetical protein ABIN67_20340, partial [Ferruginibacter sp.]
MIRIYKLMAIQLLLLIILLLAAIITFSQESRQLAVDKPAAIADLKTLAGASLVNAKWFVQNAHVVDAGFKAPGPGINGDPLPLYATGTTIKTHAIHPQIGMANFDAGFTPIAADALERRQGTGLFSFVWYKVELIVPTVIG